MKQILLPRGNALDATRIKQVHETQALWKAVAMNKELTSLQGLPPSDVCRGCGEPFTKERPATEWEWHADCHPKDEQ